MHAAEGGAVSRSSRSSPLPCVFPRLLRIKPPCTKVVKAGQRLQRRCLHVCFCDRSVQGITERAPIRFRERPPLGVDGPRRIADKLSRLHGVADRQSCSPLLLKAASQLVPVSASVRSKPSWVGGREGPINAALPLEDKTVYATILTEPPELGQLRPRTEDKGRGPEWARAGARAGRARKRSQG